MASPSVSASDIHMSDCVPLVPPSAHPVCCASLTASTLHVQLGALGRTPARFLLDTGATHAFCTLDFARRTRLTVRPHSIKSVLLADTSCPVAVVGRVRASVRMGAFACVHDILVMESPASPDFDVLLGQTFLRQHKCVLNYSDSTVTLMAGPRQVVLDASDGSSTTAGVSASSLVAQLPALTQPLSDKLITGKAACKAVRRGAPAVLYWVKPEFVPAARTQPDSTASSGSAFAAVADQQPPEVAALLSEFSDVFQDLPSGLPPDRGVNHTIPIADSAAEPPFRRPYRMSPSEKEEVQRQVTELLNKGWIQPSTSPYGAPILFVQKPDGSLRMCVDYRALNAITVKNRYPMPRIDDIFDMLTGAKFFTSIDLQQGYHQIRIRPEDVPKTAVNSPMGHYEYLVLTFGLTNAPATFQTVMNRIFAKQLNRYVAVYLDDILIFSRSLSEHLQHLREVLQILRREKLYAKLAKCDFCKQAIRYLGHLVTPDGLRIDPAKCDVVQKWPTPANLRELRGFLGLANYFRRFIQGYSSLVAPLFGLLKTDTPFVWSSDCANAFAAVKRALVSAPVLRLPDFGKPFELITDASLLGIGAVLLQDGHPLSYYSRKFTPAERNYSTGEQELLAVFAALTEWRCYLEGSQTTLVTDHCPLTYLQTQSDLSRRQARWMQFMARFHYTWQYRPGRVNVADPISRCPSLAFVQAQELNGPVEMPVSQAILAAYPSDPFFSDSRKTAALTRTDLGFWLQAGRNGAPPRIVVPACATLRTRIIREHHDTPLAGHPGRDRTLELVTRTFWWPSVHADVNRYVLQCDGCQRNKSRTGPTPGLLQSLPIVDEPWQGVTMDFITGLLATDLGFDAIAVFVCRLTKMAHFVPCTTTITAEQLAELFFTVVVARHGEPESLISDRQAVMSGQFLQAYTALLGTQSRLSTAYRPQTDGQTERTNRTLEDMLRAFVAPEPNNWDKLLPAAEFAYNNAYHSSVGASPFFLNYGRNPRTPFARMLPIKFDVPAARAKAELIADALARAKRCIAAAHERQALNYNKGKVAVAFAPGDRVLLNAKNLRRGPGSKVRPPWLGPFTVVRMVGAAAVQLELPKTLRIHPTFHVSLLKPYRGDGPSQPVPVGQLDVDPDGSLIFAVDAVVDYRLDRKRFKVRNKYRYKPIHRYQVKWRGYDSAHNAWLEPSDFADNGLAIADYWRSQGKPCPHPI